MFRRFIGFCKRIINSKAFRICVFIFSLAVLASCVYGVVKYLDVAKEIGISTEEALQVFFGFPSKYEGVIISVEGILVGAAIGLFFILRRLKKKRKARQPDEQQEEQPEEQPEESPAVQEEEIIEKPRYLSR